MQKNMKIVTGLLTGLLFLSVATLGAQTPLGERLGGATTQFTIITDSLVILNDREQLLIKPGVRDYERDINGAYGYGYESVHLEFVADQPIENPVGAFRAPISACASGFSTRPCGKLRGCD